MTAPTDTTGLLVAAGLIVVMAAVIFVFAAVVFAVFFRAAPHQPDINAFDVQWDVWDDGKVDR